MGDPSLEAFLAPLRGKPWLKVNSPQSNFIGVSEDELLYRLKEYREATVAAARAEIVGWLDSLIVEARRKETEAELIEGPMGSGTTCARVLRQTIETITGVIRAGAPQRWAAEREGQGDG